MIMKHSAKHFLSAAVEDVKNVMHQKGVNKYTLACTGKTGSTHIKKWLDRYGLHMDFDDRSGGSASQRDVFSTQIQSWNGPSQRVLTEDELNMGVTIGVVRSPFEWLHSLFIYNNTPGLAFPDYPEMKVFGEINFEQFIYKWYETGFGERGSHSLPYGADAPGKGDYHRQRTLMHWSVVDGLGKIYPDFIVRTEYLNDGLSILLQAAGVDTHVTGKSNVSRHSTNDSVKNAYTPEMVDMINKLHARELESYGYTFDGPIDDHPLIQPNGVIIRDFTTDFKPDYTS